MTINDIAASFTMHFPTESESILCITAPVTDTAANGSSKAPARDISAKEAAPATSEPENKYPPANESKIPAAVKNAGFFTLFFSLFIHITLRIMIKNIISRCRCIFCRNNCMVKNI